MVQQHILRYRELLEHLMGRARLNRKQLGERLGWSRGQVTKVLQKGDLRLSQLLSILEALGIEPRDFFLLAHGTQENQDLTLAERVLGKLGTDVERAPLLLPPVLSEEELERRIEEAVRRVMKQPQS